MKKSPDITKYDINWQIVRSQVKGGKTDINSKLALVRGFWNKNKSHDNQERILNWLEGLRMGYIASKNQNAINLIDKEYSWYKQQVPSVKEKQLTDDEMRRKIASYSLKDRIRLWKDLFLRNKKWLLKGYFHQGHNHFMDLMYDVFVQNKELENISAGYSFDDLLKLRQQSQDIENTHKFFF